MTLTLIDFCVEMPCGDVVTGLSMPTAVLLARWHRRVSSDGFPQVRLRMRERNGNQWLVPLESEHPWWAMKRHKEES